MQCKAKAEATQGIATQQAPPEQAPQESTQAQRPGLPSFQIAKNPPSVSSLGGSIVKSEEQNALQELQAVTELRKPV
ncbi:MAG: hypothetical protein WBM37_02800 [Nitrososphaeraceae archaeon]